MNIFKFSIYTMSIKLICHLVFQNFQINRKLWRLKNNFELVKEMLTKTYSLLSWFFNNYQNVVAILFRNQSK